VAPAIKPEDRAREKIDEQLAAAGWKEQSRDDVNLSAARGVAVREFKMAPKHGIADYLLFVDGEAVGALEAKKKGFTLSGVEPQAVKYSEGLPPTLDAPVEPLPFLYLSTGVETQFINLLDPHPRSRRVFNVHQPDTVAEWMQADSLPAWVSSWKRRPGTQPGEIAEAEAPHYGKGPKPSSLRARLRHMPPVEIPNMWQNKVEAITNLEKSLYDDRRGP
jgi:type I restriction enzyme R subunit